MFVQTIICMVVVTGVLASHELNVMMPLSELLHKPKATPKQSGLQIFTDRLKKDSLEKDKRTESVFPMFKPRKSKASTALVPFPMRKRSPSKEMLKFLGVSEPAAPEVTAATEADESAKKIVVPDNILAGKRHDFTSPLSATVNKG